jgi:hypothetical protein
MLKSTKGGCPATKGTHYRDTVVDCQATDVDFVSHLARDSGTRINAVGLLHLSCCLIPIKVDRWASQLMRFSAALTSLGHSDPNNG